MSSAASEHPTGTLTSTRDESNRDAGRAYPADFPRPASARPSARPSVPSDSGGYLLPEAHTMDVSVRSTDIGGPPTIPSVVDRAVILRMDGVQAGQIIGLEAFPFTVGRHPTNRLRIDEDSISRFHGRIVRQDDGFAVEDLGSRNGTFVAGKRITRATLDHDSWLQFGPRVSFRFSLTDAREERLLRKLYESSTRDALTGAYNRLHFDERLRAEIAYAMRHRSEVSLLMMDLDHFKRINDTHGHPAGDLVLKRVSEICTRALRTEDVFARYGGEEFAIVLRGVSVRGAARLGERLRTALLAERIHFDGVNIPVTLSAGCASLACCATPSAEELVATADRRLYRAKQLGRDQVAQEG